LPRREPGARLGATAIDAHLSGAQELLEPTMRQVGIMAPEPAVEPHAVLAGIDRPCLDWRSLRHCTPVTSRSHTTAIALDLRRLRITWQQKGRRGMESP